MIELIIYTDFVDEIILQAKKLNIEVTQSFHYIFGSFVKVKAKKLDAIDLIETTSFLISDVKDLKKERCN